MNHLTPKRMNIKNHNLKTELRKLLNNAQTSQTFVDKEENETYSEDAEGNEIVSVEDKMRQVYELVFLKDFEEELIGKLKFCKSFKNELIRIAGLTSQHADFST